jgi:hypothetical protein
MHDLFQGYSVPYGKIWRKTDKSCKIQAHRRKKLPPSSPSQRDHPELNATWINNSKAGQTLNPPQHGNFETSPIDHSYSLVLLQSSLSFFLSLEGSDKSHLEVADDVTISQVTSFEPEWFRRLVPVIPYGYDNTSYFVWQVRQIYKKNKKKRFRKV